MIGYRSFMFLYDFYSEDMDPAKNFPGARSADTSNIFKRCFLVEVPWRLNLFVKLCEKV